MNSTKKSARPQAYIEVIDGDTPKLNLATSEDVRREMSKVYREARSSKIASQEATRLVYILTQILKAHEMYVLEKRLLSLELTHSGGLK